MRTANPSSVRDDFHSALDNVLDAIDGAESSTLSAEHKKLVTEMGFLAAATLWEGFLSDLIVAYINRSRGTFKAYVERKYSVTSTDTVAKRATAYVTVQMNDHLTLDQIRGILDPNNYNITFSSVSDMKAKAGQWLDPPHGAGILSLTPAQVATIEAWTAVRNQLAHRSRSARSRMNAALTEASLPAPFRRGGNEVSDTGKFLRAIPSGTTDRRVHHYLLEMRAVSTVVCP